MTLGQQIRQAREKKGVSVGALAKRMNIDAQRVREFEEDLEEPDMLELAATSDLNLRLSRDLTGSWKSKTPKKRAYRRLHVAFGLSFYNCIYNLLF